MHGNCKIKIWGQNSEGRNVWGIGKAVFWVSGAVSPVPVTRSNLEC